MWIWYLDRGSALVAYAALWLAVLTGILHTARALGSLHEAARRTHVPASVVASVTLLLHVAVGSVDAWLVLSSRVPHPAFSDAYLLVGLLVGVAALLLIVVSVLGFIDARRFQRPWDPRAVHALAYGGFVFATLHAVAVGSDLATLAWPGLAAITGLLLFALALRVLADRLSSPPRARAGGPPGGP